LRAAFRTVLVSALAIVLLAIFLRNADLSRVWAELTTARTDLVLLAVVLTFAMAFVRAERWQYLLAPLGPTRFWTAFRTTIIGFAVSFVLPARAGEVLRPYLLARREQLPATAVFATIIVERLLDLLTVVILLVCFFLFLQTGESGAAPTLHRAVVVGAWIVAPASFVLLIGMFLMAGHPERVHALVLTMQRVLPARIARALAGFMRTFAQGLAVVRSPMRLVWAMVWSVVLWLAIAAQLWVVVRAFDIALPPGGALLVTAILVVGVAVPTPGGVGGTHEALRLSLTTFYGADNDAAVGAAILQHGVNFVPYLLLGFWFIAQEGLNMTTLRALSVTAREDAAESRREGATAMRPDASATRAHDATDWPRAGER
jgi:glycosyltransferase 2 family protein